MNIFSTCLELKTVNYQAFHNTCMWEKNPLFKSLEHIVKLLKQYFSNV